MISEEELYKGYIEDSEFDKVKRRLGLAILDYIATMDYSMRAELWMVEDVLHYLDSFITNYREVRKENGKDVEG